MSVQQELISKLPLLKTDTQRKYAEVILSKSAVLYIEDKAGVGKSSILRRIANILGMQIIDLVISQVDESDLGIYPKTGTYITKDGKEVECFRYLPPEWAIKASEVPTLVIFEELNRSSIEKRNACLQILNDYKVGQFEMNKENVYFAASGNIGHEDGNDVDIFDNAMINRLCVFRHNSDYPTWKEEYGKENVSRYIMEYLDSTHGASIYDDLSKSNKEKKPFASHRSWSNLSKYVMSIHHKDPNDINSGIKDWGRFVDSIKNVGTGYIGLSNTNFHKFLLQKENLSVNDVIDRFDDIRKLIVKADVSDITRLINEMIDIGINELEDHQLDNIFRFMDLTSEKELVATYVKGIFTKSYEQHPKTLHLMKDHPDLFDDRFVRNYNKLRDKYKDIYKQAIRGSSNEELNF